MSVEIRVETDEEEAALLAAHKAGELDIAGLDFVIRRDHRTLGGRSSNNAVITAHWGDRDGAGVITRGSGGGSGGTNAVNALAPGTGS